MYKYYNKNVRKAIRSEWIPDDELYDLIDDLIDEIHEYRINYFGSVTKEAKRANSLMVISRPAILPICLINTIISSYTERRTTLMSKINKEFGGQCIFCKQYGAKDYSIHGFGKHRIINYFHIECYCEAINTRHRCTECDYYLSKSGRCNGMKWAPEVNCKGDRNKCELKED